MGLADTLHLRPLHIPHLLQGRQEAMVALETRGVHREVVITIHQHQLEVEAIVARGHRGSGVGGMTMENQDTPHRVHSVQFSLRLAT